MERKRSHIYIWDNGSAMVQWLITFIKKKKSGLAVMERERNEGNCPGEGSSWGNPEWREEK